MSLLRRLACLWLALDIMAAIVAAGMVSAAGGQAEKGYRDSSQSRYYHGPERDRFYLKKPNKLPVPPRLQQPAGSVSSQQTATGAAQNEQPTTEAIPSPAGELAGVALWDMGGKDDNWPQVAQIVREVVTDAGLGLREIEYDKGREPEPLVTRMPTAQSLLIIGSHRTFSQAEAQAVADHVRTGGALLAIANATPGRQRRIADVNRILSEFGLAARLTRPGGRAQVADQPLTHNVRLQQLPGGISFWSFRDWELVTVSGEAAASADVAQNGRIFAVDGRMLVSSDKRVAGEFRQLLTNAVLWLAGKQ